jgi:hypothetical protein
LSWIRASQLKSFDVKGCNSFIFRIASVVTETGPRKSPLQLEFHDLPSVDGREDSLTLRRLSFPILDARAYIGPDGLAVLRAPELVVTFGAKDLSAAHLSALGPYLSVAAHGGGCLFQPDVVRQYHYSPILGVAIVLFLFRCTKRVPWG